MTGWTWDYVENHMTVPRLKAMHEEWQRNPPLPLMIATYLGIRKEHGSSDNLIERIKEMQSK